MSVQPKDVYDQLRLIRKDLSYAQSKLTDVFRMLDALNLPSEPDAQCPTCGTEFGGKQKLAEHMYQTHDGPLPEHWARVDAMVAQ